MPIDSKETKNTILLESAFAPAAVPNVAPEKIMRLYDGKPPCYTENIKKNTITNTFSPEDQKELDIFNHQIAQLVTIIEKACNKLEIKQSLLNNLDDFSKRFQARDYDRQTALFYSTIKQSLEKIAVCLSDSSLKTIGKKQLIIDFLSEIHKCGPGIYNHINTATINFLTPDTIETWLAIFRRTIIRALADRHVKNKNISAGNSIHVQNVFLRYAYDQGWNPYGFDAKAMIELHENLAEVTSQNLTDFHQAFLKAYNPSTIMRELATLLTDRILTRITDSIAKERKAALEKKALDDAKPPALFAEEKKPSKTTLSSEIPSESYIEIKSTEDQDALKALDELLGGLPLYTKQSGMHTIFDTTDFNPKERKTPDEKKQEKPIKPPPFILFGGKKLTPKPIPILMVALTHYLITQNNPLFETVPEGNYTLVRGCPEISYKHNFDDPSSPIPLSKRLLPLICKNILVAENAPAPEDMKADTLQLVRNNGRLTAYWMEDLELMSHYFKENEVQDIMQKLPKTETISDDAELMEMIATKYGSFTSDINLKILKKYNLSIPISNTYFKNAYLHGDRDFSQEILDSVDLTKYDINDFIFTSSGINAKKATLYNVKVTPLQYLHLFYKGVAITKLRYDEKDLIKEMPIILARNPSEQGALLFFAITNKLQNFAGELLKAGAETNIVNASQENKPKPIHIAAEEGQLDIVKTLLTHNHNLLEQTDAFGQTPLILAAANGQVEVVDYLIKQHAELDASTLRPGHKDDGKTALYWATENGHAEVVTRLVQAGATTTTALGAARCQPIHIAAQKGNVLVVQALMENKQGENTPELTNQTDAHGETPLMWAAYHGHLAVVNYLLEKKANLEFSAKYPDTPDHGKTALYYAVEKGHAEIVASLIQADADITRVFDEDKHHPIHIAAKKGNLAVIKALIKNIPAEKIPDLINQTDAFGQTPLMFAAGKGYLEVVNYLLEKNSNVNIVTTHPTEPGRTALFYAIANEHAEVVGRLVHARANTTSFGEHKLKPIHFAVITGNLSVVQAIMENTPPEQVPELLNQTDAQGQTPLMSAAQNGHLEIVDYLIKKKTKLNTTTEPHKKTALDYAVENGQAKVAARLIQAGASTLTVLGAEKYRPIHIAALKGDVAMVQALIENDPGCLNQRDAYNQTPLMLAAAKGHSNVANYLINKKADLKPYIKKPGELGLPKTALDLAIEGKHDAVIASLIQVKAPCFSLPPSPTMKFHRIHIAAQEGQLETLMVLLAEDPTLIDQPDAYGQTPLLWAAAKGHLKLVEYLITQGAKLDCATQRPGHKDHGKTALYWAAENGDQAIVGILLKAGPIARKTSPYMKYHPIHLAAYKGNLDAIKKFVDDDLSLLDQVDGSGRTPLLWAIEREHFGLVYYLINKKISLIPAHRPSGFMFIQECYEQNFNELYRALSNIINEYMAHLDSSILYTNNDAIMKKRFFINGLQSRLNHSQDQNIETKLQVIDEIYKLIAANEDLGKHRSISSSFSSLSMIIMYLTMVCIIFLILPVILLATTAFFPVIITVGIILSTPIICMAIRSKLTYNTAKFWKSEGYKQKEHFLSEISIFKNKTKRLESQVKKAMRESKATESTGTCAACERSAAITSAARPPMRCA